MFGFEKSPRVPYGTGAFNQAKDTHMIRTIGAAALMSLALTMPAQQAAAQDPLSVLGGAAAGAVIGGAAVITGGTTAATCAPRAVGCACRDAIATDVPGAGGHRAVTGRHPVLP